MAYGLKERNFVKDYVGGYSAGREIAREKEEAPYAAKLRDIQLRRDESALESSEKRMTLQDMSIRDMERKEMRQGLTDLGNAAKWADTPEKFEEALNVFEGEGSDVSRFRGRFDMRDTLIGLADPSYAKQQKAVENISKLVQQLPAEKRGAAKAYAAVDPKGFAREAGEQLMAGEPSGFEGQAMPAQIGNLMVKGVEDPAFRETPEYRYAWQQMSEPKIQRTPTGDILIYPQIDSAFLPPGKTKTVEEETAEITDKAKEDKKIIAGTERELKTTEGEKAGAGYLNRMQAATGRIDDLGEFDASSVWELSRGITNVTASENYQHYRQAAADWIRAKLRKESGAVIAPAEMAQEYETYFPMFGDKQKVLDAKKEARVEAEKAMKIAAGLAGSKVTKKGKQPRINKENLTVTIDGRVSTFPSADQMNAYLEAAGYD